MSREALRIAVAQPVSVAYDVALNARTHAATVRAAGARVVVFPELSLTGYLMDAPAIGVEDARLEPLVEACAETGSVALIGAPVQGEAGRSHIAMLAVDGSGARVAYRKVWVDSTESDRFSPGETPAVLEVDGWRLGLAICRDSSIRQHASDTAALGIDAYVAGVVLSPDETALLDERARRIAADHRVWVALASFAGSTGGGYVNTAGCSGIWSADGAVIAQAGPETGAVARATLTGQAPGTRSALRGPSMERSPNMPQRHPNDDRTLQDDRAELAADPHEGSPLAEGEGAPLAEDDVPETEEPVITHALLGGAAVPIVVEESPKPSSAHAMTTAEDRPIGD